MTLRERIRKWLGIEGHVLLFRAADAEIDSLKLQLTLAKDRVSTLESRVDALTVRAKPHKPDSVFDSGDKIAPTGPTRYVPLSRRRAAAEAASLGPQSHAEQVRANNAKAMETP